MFLFLSPQLLLLEYIFIWHGFNWVHSIISRKFAHHLSPDLLVTRHNTNSLFSYRFTREHLLTPSTWGCLIWAFQLSGQISVKIIGTFFVLTWVFFTFSSMHFLPLFQLNIWDVFLERLGFFLAQEIWLSRLWLAGFCLFRVYPIFFTSSWVNSISDSATLFGTIHRCSFQS